MDVKVIGLGGIGTALLAFLPRYLAFDQARRKERDILTLIDGDHYEPNNMQRQAFGEFGDKADVKAREVRREQEYLAVNSIVEYVKPDNIANIIEEGNVVFLGVDNHKTRKLVSDHCGTLRNVVLVSGGNELTDGNVQVYVRKGGVDVTPSLSKYHPEIENPADKRPDEMSCEELAQSRPQLLFTNAAVAVAMLTAFYAHQSGPLSYSEAYLDIVVGKNNAMARKA